MNENYATTRIWVETKRKLKVLAAQKGMSMVELLEEMVEEKKKQAEVKVVQNA